MKRDPTVTHYKPAGWTPADPPLDAEDLAVLRWVAERPRCAGDCPAGVGALAAAVSRRRLAYRGLIELRVGEGDEPSAYAVTEAGEKLLVESKPRTETRGRRPQS